MAKKLNSLSKDLNMFNEKLTQEVTTRFGNKYTVEVNKYFKKSEVQKLIVDYISFKEELPNYVSNLELVRDNTVLFPILLVKYFTSVSMPDTLPEMITMAFNLIDIEVFDKIIGAMPQHEIERVNELIKKMTDELPSVLPQINEVLGVEEDGI